MSEELSLHEQNKQRIKTLFFVLLFITLGIAIYSFLNKSPQKEYRVTTTLKTEGIQGTDYQIEQSKDESYLDDALYVDELNKDNIKAMESNLNMVLNEELIKQLKEQMAEGDDSGVPKIELDEVDLVEVELPELVIAPVELPEIEKPEPE